MYIYILYTLVSLSISWWLVKIVIRHGPELGLVDRPNQRSMHVHATPRGGGLGLVFIWLFGGLASSFMGSTLAVTGIRIAVYVATAFSIAAISLRDDFRSVGAGFRFCIHIGAAITSVLIFASYDAVELWSIFYLGKIGLLLTIIWVVGLTNVFNFMDGIDGIAGLQGLVAGLAWCIAGVILGIPFLSFSAALLAGGCGGFLIHNWSPAKIFMGDVGSAFLGFCFATCPLIAMRELAIRGANEYYGRRLPVFALIVVWPFVADGAFTFCRRAIKREPVWKPHRSHMYQRMVRAGWLHWQVASYYGVWAVLSAIAGIVFLLGGTGYGVSLVGVLFTVITWTLTIYLGKE
jgi:UDP-N-acetylmuramyl pentapeptide phosphotransferase/UDP-N-acetylglucosamine-1-phosphate transferase